MSDPENLLARWSRRKSGFRADARDVDAAVKDAEASAPGLALAPSAEAALPVDLTSLPALDSIGAGTELRAFLGRGVPAELARAALRRGWSADPAIRDFVGLSENSWDFNAPDGIPGFGALEPGEVQRLLARLTGEAEMDEPVAPASAAPASLDRAVPPPTECAAKSELPQDSPANDLSSSGDRNAQRHSDPAPVVSADGTEVPASTPSLIHQPDVRTPSGPHRHGGASPRFDAD